MKCKFCDAELEEGSTVCPQCGKDNREELPEQEMPAEETEVTPGEDPVNPEAVSEEEITAEEPVKKKKTGKIVLTVVGILALVAVLVGAVLYGTGAFSRKDGALVKDSYTVSAEKAAKEADRVVAALGDYELTNGELQIYYGMTASNFLNSYGQMVGVDPRKPLDAQVQDKETGKTWQQFFVENSILTWQRYATLLMMGNEAHFELDSDTQEFLDGLKTTLDKAAKQSGFQDADAFVKAQMGPNTSLEDYFHYMTTYYESLGYYDSVYDELKPTDEEIEAYYDAHGDEYTGRKIPKDDTKTVDVRHILIEPENGKPNDKNQMIYSEEDWKACEVKAQKLLADWQAGEASEASFADLAVKNTMDPGSKQDGGLYSGVRQGQMVPEFDAWIFDAARTSGDSGLVKTKFGYHLMYFVDSQLVWKETAKEDLIGERTEKMLADGMAKWPMEAFYKKVALFDPFAVEPEETKPAESVPETTVPETTVPETTAP